MATDDTLYAAIPPRRFLTREEAAAWLSVSVETFEALGTGTP